MPGPFMQQGDEGPSVSALQLALTALGFDTGGVDGVFGGTTASAVQQFQDNQGIAASGAVDHDTWSAIAGQSFGQDERVQVSPTEFPSISRAIFFSENIDAYLEDLGIDAASISDDDLPNA